MAGVDRPALRYSQVEANNAGWSLEGEYVPDQQGKWPFLFLAVAADQSLA